MVNIAFMVNIAGFFYSEQFVILLLVTRWHIRKS